MPAKFTVTKDKAGDYRFTLIAPNGQVIAVSQGYGSKAAALNGVASVRRNAGAATLVDGTVMSLPAQRTAAQSAKTAKPRTSSTPSKPAATVKATKAAKAVKATKAAKPAKAVKSVKVAAPTKAAEPATAAKSVKAVKATKAVKAVKTTRRPAAKPAPQQAQVAVMSH